MRLLILAFMSGCAHTRQPPQVSLADVDWKAVASAGAQVIDAIPSTNKTDCLAKAAARTVLLTAPDFIGQKAVPGFDLDISACVDLEPVSSAADASSVIAVASIILQSQAHRIEDACTESWLVAVVKQLESAASAIFNELSHPDGMISVPAVAVDCGG
jgi:hypothetical protein